jgi:hypothetical protein
MVQACADGHLRFGWRGSERVAWRHRGVATRRECCDVSRALVAPSNECGVSPQCILAVCLDIIFFGACGAHFYSAPAAGAFQCSLRRACFFSVCRCRCSSALAAGLRLCSCCACDGHAFSSAASGTTHFQCSSSFSSSSFPLRGVPVLPTCTLKLRRYLKCLVWRYIHGARAVLSILVRFIVLGLFCFWGGPQGGPCPPAQ